MSLLNQYFNHYLVKTLHPRSAIRENDARSDVRAEGFWSCRQQQAYFDIKVFNPTASAYRSKSLRGLSSPP